MSSFFSAALLAVPIFFFYSSRLEKGRVVTITKPLLITQARKTPAFNLYQQAQSLETPKIETQPVSSIFLNTESARLSNQVAITAMTFDHREISSTEDSGFQVTSQKVNFSEDRISDKAEDSVFGNVRMETNAPVFQANKSPMQKWGTIRGKFEVKDGVGVVDHFVEVKRVEEGQTREIGHVDLKAGTYSIDIETPQGYLKAQIKDRNGAVIGEDSQKIINLASHGTYFDGPFIRVGPTAQVGANPTWPSSGTGLAGNGNGSGKSNGSQGAASRGRSQSVAVDSGIVTTLFSNQHVLENPKDKFGNISKNASTISIIEDKKNIYAKTITIRQVSDENETPLLTKKWVSGALEYISDHLRIEFKTKSAPVLIGRVLENGKPVSGARVQLENQSLAAIYLDQFMIPNFKQEATSENGYFVFVGLEADTYSAVAFQNNKILGQQIFIAELGTVSYQNIQSFSTPHSVLIRSFDAFSGQSVDADIIAPDLEDVIEAQHGIASYRTQNSLGIANFIVRPKQNYMPINYIQDARLDYVHIPNVSESWLAALQNKYEINDQPNTGTIIGFVPELDYEMYLISENYDTKQVVYFNQQGQATTQPVPGGGFVLFNAPVGAQEIVVQEKKTEKIYSQVHIVKLNQTSVSHFVE